MVKFYLKASAILYNVTDIQPVDTEESPFEYIFRIECTKCREFHSKPVNINRFEQYEISGSRGEANFVFRCHLCKAEHSASILRTKEKLTVDNNKDSQILQIDSRGIEFKEFIPQGIFECYGIESNTKFTDIDLSESEWYDYDDKEGVEVNITDIKWAISRS